MKQSFGEIVHIWGKTLQSDDGDKKSLRNLVSVSVEIGKSIILVKGVGEGVELNGKVLPHVKSTLY